MADCRRQGLQSCSIATLLITAGLRAHACWDDAAARYQVSSTLLHAIARTESGLNPQAIGRNRDGSRDIGLMQINSGWLPTLARHGIREQDLFDACTSIHVGAWILAHNIARYGYTWEAVGAYNATSPPLRQAYAAKVRRNLAALPSSSGSALASPVVRRPPRPAESGLTVVHP